MRYRQLIKEDFASEQTILNAAKTIKQNCQPYLQQNKDAINRYPMYRGVKPPGGHSVTGAGDANVIRKDVRLTDRKPSDMPRELHHFINQYFMQNYGAAFRTAMFVSGSSAMASDYGTTYIIFPAGEFQYLWSDSYEDLFSITSEFGLDDNPPSSLDAEEAIEWKENSKEELVDGVLRTYQTDELMKGIDSKHEIMIRCSHYYGIHSDVMYNKELREKIIEVLYG